MSIAHNRCASEILISENVFSSEERIRRATGHLLGAGHALTGLSVPYSPEYKSIGEAASVLPELTRATNGQTIADPALAFAPIAQPATRSQPIWPALLMLAVLLFPLDVAVRRGADVDQPRNLAKSVTVE